MPPRKSKKSSQNDSAVIDHRYASTHKNISLPAWLPRAKSRRSKGVLLLCKGSAERCCTQIMNRQAHYSSEIN
jgi:hypothetical protein